MWFGKHLSNEIDLDSLKLKQEQAVSHDKIFHTLLGLMEIETTEYDQQLDLLASDRETEHLDLLALARKEQD